MRHTLRPQSLYVAFATDDSVYLCHTARTVWNRRSGARVADENVRRLWSANRLLAAVPAVDCALLEPYAQLVQLVHRQVLFEPEEDVVITHFPLTGTMAALVVVLEDGTTGEAATIGREGAIGGIVSGGHKPAFARAVTEIAGAAIRIETARIEVAKERSLAVRELFARYADALLAQILQSVTCNAVHSLQQRFARWLLMTSDQVGSAELPLTQQTIGAMLGVHRTSVMRVASALQNQGLIRYGRGRLTIVNRADLEQTACECYRAVARHAKRVAPKAKSGGKSPRRRN
jgi:CRP-like cAMP-binding protein